MEFKTRSKIPGAARVKKTVFFAAKDINVDHNTALQAKMFDETETEALLI